MANVGVARELDEIVRLSSWDSSSSLCLLDGERNPQQLLCLIATNHSRVPSGPWHAKTPEIRLRQQGSIAVLGHPVEQGVHRHAVREEIMCDYSLHAIRSRLAVQGERLIIHRFQTDSIGMAPVPEASEVPEVEVGFWRKLFCLEGKARSAECAVCIPPGARLLLHNIPADLQRRAKAAETERVTFTQITARENTYRDAVRFESGLEILLQYLKPGQLVEVLSLGSEETTFRERNLEGVLA